MDRHSIHIASLTEFESALDRLNCRVALRTSLRTYPGSIHWHIKKNGEKSGMLEMTLLLNGEAWLATHTNRFQPWIDDVVKQLT